MISRNLYFQILIRVLLIVFPALAAGWMMASGQPVVFVFLCIFIIIIVVVNLVNYLN